MQRLDDDRDDDVMKLAEHVLKTRFGYTLADISPPPEVTSMGGKLLVGTMLEYGIGLGKDKDFDPALVAGYAAKIIIKLNDRIAELEAELRKLKGLASSSS